MWLEGQGLQDCQRKIWQSPNEDSSNSQREIDSWTIPFVPSSFVLLLDWMKPILCVSSQDEKETKARIHLPAPLWVFFVSLTSFVSFDCLCQTSMIYGWNKGGRCSGYRTMTLREKKRQDWAQNTGKSSRGDIRRAALRAMDWPTLSSSYTLEDAKTRWGPRLVQTFLQNRTT